LPVHGRAEPAGPLPIPDAHVQTGLHPITEKVDTVLSHARRIEHHDVDERQPSIRHRNIRRHAVSGSSLLPSGISKRAGGTALSPRRRRASPGEAGRHHPAPQPPTCDLPHCQPFHSDFMPSSRMSILFGQGLNASYFMSMPWGRAGPVGKAVLKSSWNRGSSDIRFGSIFKTCTLRSPSRWITPKLSSLRK
jgi:hypothetical protein